MNGFTLKIIAVVAMLIDHAAAILLPQHLMAYVICRGIGRLAFPLYCFLLVEGFFHTKNVKKYMMRLGIFALISEIPFDLAFSDKTKNMGFILQQNVFFTLFIGLVVIYIMSIIEKKYEKNLILSNLFASIVVIVGGAVATLFFTDYSYIGVLLIAAFYLFRKTKILLILSVLIINAYLVGGLQTLGTISMLFILLYNGKKGPQFNKYVFYAFYPVHILCLYLISLYLVF